MRKFAITKAEFQDQCRRVDRSQGRHLEFYRHCAAQASERACERESVVRASGLHENARRERISVTRAPVATRRRALVHPPNEHRSPAANPCRAHPSRQRHPAAGRRPMRRAMPIKHQNGASLRQLYGVTADARRRAGADRFAICQQSSRKTVRRTGPMHRGELRR